MTLKLMTRLEELLNTVVSAEVSAAEGTLPPVRMGEDVVGALTPDLQKMFALVCRLGNECKLDAERVERYSFSDVATMTPQQLNLRAEQTNTIVAQHQAARDIFWAAVRVEFNLFAIVNLSLRAGWKVVATDPVCTHCGGRHPEKATGTRTTSSIFILSMFG
jgi:hypothetical protein